MKNDNTSLCDTAGAIGEINTKMHLTGEELTDVTEKFLDYADITGSNVVTSVQDVPLGVFSVGGSRACLQTVKLTKQGYKPKK